MKIKQIDSYITSTQSLLKSNPSGATITITYTHSKKKNDDKLRSIIKFKTYDAKTGICHVFKTHKIKELSKLFNALGPRGCNVNGEDIDGLSLLLSNTEKSEVVQETLPEITTTTDITKIDSDAATETNQKKKKNKKKGKK